MPTENPTPRSVFAEIEAGLHALHLYGAGGLAAYGWAMGWLLEADARRWVPLWFCGGLLIYNADRLRRDPADSVNVPVRTAASARYRSASFIALALAAVVLVGLPLARREWLTLALVIGGTGCALGYSLPILGYRWKDVPFVKTLFAPAVVTVAVFGLLLLGAIAPLLYGTAYPYHQDPFDLFDQGTLLTAWAFCFLLFNMLLCDLRDLAGDRQCGIRSMPVLLGENGTRRLLWALAVVGQILLARLILVFHYSDLPFALLSLVTGLYQAWLLHATRHPRSERFYEWAVEGLLYLPALACGLAWLVSRRPA